MARLRGNDTEYNIMRVWDIHPGYLNRQSLLGEHRELHAIVSIFRNNKKGYSRHPETLRWKGFGWALNQRHKLLAAEMNLRGFTDRSPVVMKTQPQKWPEIFVDPPASQFSILARKYINKELGRIPLPQNVQQLWAQHKYSVMARDVTEYKRIGRLVASRKNSRGMDDIYPELISLLRLPPREGNLKNTVQHMWGYVSSYAPFPAREIDKMTLLNLLRLIQVLAITHDVVYLKESTALSDLMAWMF